MKRLNTLNHKTVLDMIKDSSNVYVESITPFSSVSDVNKILGEIKSEISKSKGKDITLITSIK